ncbi:MAG: carboxypeptidase regulatory-like domain-containing protein, partial [Acidobacteriota bacterium]|nr:carboxypeptidase regulatory-like domain-containing protein [Acidobacteriota bacterium]
MKFWTAKLYLLAATLALFMTASERSLSAQQTGGYIRGIIEDASGAVIPGAKVDVVSIERGTQTHLLSNNAGEFTTPTLNIGTYQVTVTYPGFKTVIQNGVVIQVEGVVELTLKLPVGETSAVVSVKAEAPTLNFANATIGTTVESKEIAEIPLNGRNVLALVFTTENVRSGNGPLNDGFADRGASLSSVSINGSPNGMNANVLDGINNLQTYEGEVSINPTVDAISEFKVISGSMPAEYGFTTGGVIAMATRSGANDLHGGVYDFFRNDALDAIQFSSTVGPTGISKPRLRYNQFGGYLGGPIKKNRAFYFGNYEGFRFLRETAQIGTVPTLQERQGDFSDLFSGIGAIPIYDPSSEARCTANSTNGTCRFQYGYGAGATRGAYGNPVLKGTANVIPSSQLDPVAVNIQNLGCPSNCVVPTPNRTPDIAATHLNNYAVHSPNHRSMDQGTGRLDMAISPRQSIFARYSLYRDYNDNGGASILTNPIVALRYDHIKTQSAVVGYTYASQSFVNDLRLGINRTSFNFSTASAGAGWPQKLGLPGSVPGTTFPIIAGSTLPTFNTGTVGFRASTDPEVVDVVAIGRGNHNLRTGFDWRLNRGNNLQTYEPSGQYMFSALQTAQAPTQTTGKGYGYASFLSGSVASALVSTQRGETDRGWSLSGFAHDEYRGAPNVTLNFGVRYDFQSVPVEQNNGFSNFNPYIPDPISGLLGAEQYAGVNGAPRSFTQPSYHAIGPRAGFAVMLTKDGKTSFRGGYGMYFANNFNVFFFGDTTGFATTNTSYVATNGLSFEPAFQFAAGLPFAPIPSAGAALGSNGFLGQGVSYTEPKGNYPTSQQFDISIQRELPYNILVDLSYEGNHGTHLVSGNYNLNALNPSYFPLGNRLVTTNVDNPYFGKVPTGGVGSAKKITLQQSLLAYPYYGPISDRYPRNGNLVANAFIVSVQMRSYRGLDIRANYTKSKIIDDSIQPLINYAVTANLNNNRYQNPYDREAERSLDPNDISQRANFSVLYELPFGNGKQFLRNSNGLVDRIVSGWQINTVTVLQTGFPLAIAGGGDTTHPNTRPNFVPGVSYKNANPTRLSWFNGAAFVEPSPWNYGNVPRT